MTTEIKMTKQDILEGKHINPDFMPNDIVSGPVGSMQEVNGRLMFFSDRGFPLTHRRIKDHNWDIPVLCVELHTKWYRLYLVMPDNTVRTCADWDILKNQYQDYCDHVWSPKTIAFLGQALGFNIDEQTLELVTGRWIHEIVEDDSYILNRDERELNPEELLFNIGQRKVLTVEQREQIARKIQQNSVSGAYLDPGVLVRAHADYEADILKRLK